MDNSTAKSSPVRSPTFWFVVIGTSNDDEYTYYQQCLRFSSHVHPTKIDPPEASIEVCTSSSESINTLPSAIHPMSCHGSWLNTICAYVCTSTFACACVPLWTLVVVKHRCVCLIAWSPWTDRAAGQDSFFSRIGSSCYLVWIWSFHYEPFLDISLFAMICITNEEYTLNLAR